MTTSIDVTKYIKSQMSTMGEVQIQKLVYYSQAWSLAWDGRPLFSDHVEAWRMGPVLPALRYRTDSVEGDANAIDADARSVVDAVIAHYGKFHGSKLSQMSHDEGPWREARGDLPSHASCSIEISHEAMRLFYTAESLAGRGPKRLSAPKGVAAQDALAIAGANARRWRGTLDLLAQ